MNSEMHPTAEAAAPGERILHEILAAKSCRLVNDVHWNDVSGQYEGSFLWHGIPTSLVSLRSFAQFVAHSGAPLPNVVAGVSSSGIAWGTAVAIHIARPLGVLRLRRHSYGTWNGDLSSYKGDSAWLVDNFVGSGETLEEAQSVLERLGLETTGVYAVEATEHHPVQALIRTEAKLRELLRRGYFCDFEQEVVQRYLGHGRRGLDDETWVRRIQAILTPGAETECA
jgi:adenine/guanine phosphoribosyltransferase-like PRPP-binding protein